MTVEVPHLSARPTAIAADATGVYLGAMVLTTDDARARRWAVLKLDGSGGVAWSAIDELVRSPAPERVLLANGGVIGVGIDGSEETARLMMADRHDASTGKRTWQRRFTARDAKCTSPDCGGKDVFGGAAVRGTSVLFSATVDRPLEEAFGELSLAKGAPGKSYTARSDLRAHDLAADDGGIYLLEDTLSSVFSLVKLGPDKTAWKQDIKTGALRIATAPFGLVLWGKTIEKRSAETGELAWTSKLAGEHLDVATDANAIYAIAMIDKGFAIAKLDPASGNVQWLRKANDYALRIAVDKDWLYICGFDGDKLYVEKRRKSDGALGEVATTARTVQLKRR